MHLINKPINSLILQSFVSKTFHFFFLLYYVNEILLQKLIKKTNNNKNKNMEHK